MEKSSAARTLPVAKEVYSFVRDNVSQSFHFPGWSKGRIVCMRPQLKRMLSMASEEISEDSVGVFFPISDLNFPLPGTQLNALGFGRGERGFSDEGRSEDIEPEILVTPV